jgi:tRNA(fMet)-specific endonuclease VapC
MTIRYLLDTMAVSEPSKPIPDPRFSELVAQHQASLATCTIVWHELLYGLERLPASRRRASLSRYLEVVNDELEMLPYDEDAAVWHAHQRAQLEACGRPVPFSDGQVAAISATNDLVLVTRNTRYFEPFEGLEIENWWS